MSRLAPRAIRCSAIFLNPEALAPRSRGLGTQLRWKVKEVRGSAFLLRSHSTKDPHCSVQEPGDVNCWNCSKFLDCITPQSEEKFRCTGCDIIQPPTENLSYFEYFGLDADFNINQQGLTRRFRQLQFLVHPDHFAQKSQTERDFADQQSSLVNKAYRTLLNPLTRSEYLLELNGVKVTEEAENEADPELLMEVLELNEEINEAESKAEIKVIEAKAAAVVAECEKDLVKAFQERKFEKAKELTGKMRYFATVLKNAHKALGWDS